MWCKCYHTHTNWWNQPSLPYAPYVKGKLILLPACCLAWACYPGQPGNQVVAEWFCLLLAMHPFRIYPWHRCKGFETISARWGKQPYLLTLQQFYFSRSVDEGVRRGRGGLSRGLGDNAQMQRHQGHHGCFLHNCSLKIWCINFYKLYYCKLNHCKLFKTYLLWTLWENKTYPFHCFYKL